MLAPDMGFGISQSILPRIRQIAENITNSAAADDRPLALSTQLHGYSHLGEADNDGASLGNVEAIDLNLLPDESPTGHLYPIYSADVGQVLDRLPNGGRMRLCDRGVYRRDQFFGRCCLTQANTRA